MASDITFNDQQELQDGVAEAGSPPEKQAGRACCEGDRGRRRRHHAGPGGQGGLARRFAGRNLFANGYLAFLPNAPYYGCVGPKTKAEYESLSRLLKALGHPSRLLMISELAKAERCVCELRDLVDADLSTVSKHLAVLRSVGLVRDERRGGRVQYRLLVPCVAVALQVLAGLLPSATLQTGRGKKSAEVRAGDGAKTGPGMRG